MMGDELLARQLQAEYDKEAAEHLERHEASQMSLGKQIRQENKFSSLSPVDPYHEFSDPNPDIRILFLQFNEEYFWGQLSGIEVKWSPRMTLCAGLCVYEGSGGLCSVRLSLPLLKLRPRKDLVETLLHEMIHAYLFITNNDRDHDGHGPNFQKHMHRINKATGANITIYHTFHDEVAAYQQHWWRCNGPCQHRKPFFGYVKRAMNRVPSSNDFWWADHKATCGGTFTKIKEPENYGKKKVDGKKNQDKSGGSDSRTFIDKGQVSSPPKNKKLFDITGKAPSFDKRNNVHGGSIFSEGKTKNKTSSTSNYVLSGGVLVRKPSLTQSSLFTSVGISNSVVPTKNLSHSVLSPKDRIMNSDSIVPKLHHDTPMAERSDEKNKYADIFHGSGKTHYKWLSHTQSSSLQNQNKNNTKLPKNFRSVCEGRGKGKGKKKRKKKNYAFDELDEDDGLWNTDSDSDQSKNNTEKRAGTTYIELPSVSPLNKKLKDTCSIANLETFSSPKVKRDILTEIVPKKLDNQNSPRGDQFSDQSKNNTEKRAGTTDIELSSVSPLNKKLKDTCSIANLETLSSPKVKRDILTEIVPEKLDNQNSPRGDQFKSFIPSKSETYFEGQGYRLGGDSKTVTPIKTYSRLGKKHKTLDSFISREKKKVVPEPKRSFDEAFPSILIDISDEEEGEDFVRQSNKKVKEEIKEEVSREFTGSEKNVLSASVSDMYEQASSSGGNGNSSLIPCPVCDAKVFHYGINTHLDMCLGMT